jgi:putative oxidoreductase
MTATIAATTLHERASGKLGTGVLAYVGLLGRIFYSAIFIMSGPNHFKAETMGYAAAQGVPLASIAVPLSGIIALLGGLSIALGYRAKLGAWLIVLFLVPVTLMLHRFWGVSDPQVAQLQLGMFMKNVSMLGAALMIARVGSGPLSLRQD